MNRRRQFVVLYREFLFRVVNRDALSWHAKGDASQLLIQIFTLLLGAGVVLCLPALFLTLPTLPQLQLMMSWTVVHFLVATTMVLVGVFGVLSWGGVFPDQRDIRVLAPLPVKGATILLAKSTALASAFMAIVVALHAVTSIAWSLKLNSKSSPYTVPALTSDPPNPPVAIENLDAQLTRDFSRAVAAGRLAMGRGGVVVGISEKGTRRILAYGAATPDSVFQIASVTKLFTGLALAHAVEQQMVRLDQPVRELIPDAGLPTPASGAEITLRDLVTHRSGLLLPPGYRPRDPENPFADFDVTKLYSLLAAHGMARPAIDRFQYSNIGYGLLGHALSTRAGVDYETLIREVITQPLGLSDTAITLRPDQERRLVQGHDRDGRPIRVWDMDVLAGAGALKSTAGDQLAWLEANLHPERLQPGVLRRAIVASHQRLAGVGSDGGIAFGWRLTSSGALAHPGDTDGFSAEVSFNPAADRALVVLANTQRGTSVSADIVAQHVRERLDGLPSIALAEVTIPARGGAASWLRLFGAYWVTMLAAGLFMFGVIVVLQGMPATMLRPAHAHRASSILQLALFGLVLGSYFLQPIAVSPAIALDAQRGPFVASSPSLWFVGLFQALSGSPALAPLADKAWMALGVSITAAMATCALSANRTIRRVAEAPDLAPMVHSTRWLPRVGSALATAVTHFSARTVLRSAPHRVIYTFYVGLGFALTALFLRTPRAGAVAAEAGTTVWTDTAAPLIVSSVVMTVCALVGARLTFAMPRDLGANWIFRMVPIRGGAPFVTARRRAFLMVAAGPIWLLAAVVFLTQWPLRPALGHLLVLGLLSVTIVELCLAGTQRIPFTCSYLPGQSRSHIVVPLAVIMLLVLSIVGADAELLALQDGRRYALMTGLLALAWGIARWRTFWASRGTVPEFDDEPEGRVVALDVWDARRL